MPIVAGPKGLQRNFIGMALEKCCHLDALAHVCGMHPRTIRDWRREKHRMPFESMELICGRFGLVVPENVELVPDGGHLSAAGRLGWQRRAMRHGSFIGSMESRRRGGLAASRKFLADPDLARRHGFIVRKAILKPPFSSELAEFVGVVLGDGCLSNKFQVSIYFNSETDRQYGLYLRYLVMRLFGLNSTLHSKPGTRCGSLTASSRALSEYLVSIGLTQGNKVLNQVDVPSWISESNAYQVACLRGLMDTDGSIYKNSHAINGRTYSHMVLSFRNHSQPLLLSVERMLKVSGLHPAKRRHSVDLYRQEDIHRYFRLVGSHNPKHVERFHGFAHNTKYLERYPSG